MTGRQVLDFGIPDGPVHGQPARRMDYLNVPPSIGFVVTSGLATLAELQSLYGTGDLWDLIEIHAVNCHNAAEAAKAQRSP
ncbi:hypothetical protein [Paraburkholderia adhaesiva]|uniref:hypothetical protein n=1 Tax=Paraburkholderia adhaesiva TaxID=2883244 RepID=UPI001F27FB2D|nr:hypothetical protein [Paraburkholderia adhaesiva]